MKRVVWGGLVLALGAFLLVAAFLADFWIPGAVQKTPKAVDETTYLSGEADKLDPAAGKVEHFPVRVTSLTRTDTKRGTDEVNVFVNDVCVVQDVDSPPDCIRASDPRLVQASTSVFATDRVTGLSVNNPKYFVGVDDVVPHTGLVNKFPFNTEKKDYPYWDDTAEEAVPATYEGTERLDGLEVYRFEMKIEGKEIEIADGIKGTYNLDKTMWIEPITGAIINQSQHDVRTLEDGTTALDLQVAFTDQTLNDGIKDGKSNVKQFKLLTQTGPLVGYIVGPLLILLGVFLILRRGSSAESPAEPAQPAHSSAT